MAAEFDDVFTPLAEALASQPDGVTMDAFWREVFALERWHFLPSVGEDGRIPSGVPDPANVGPLVGRVDGEARVFVFTSERRATHAAVTNRLVEEGQPVPVISMTRGAATEMLCAIQSDDIVGIVVNHNVGTPGITAPLDNVAAMYEQLTGTLPEACLDRFVSAAATANSALSWSRVCGQVGTLPTWFMLSRPESADQPLVENVGGTPALLAFTHQTRVEHVSNAGVVEPGTKVAVIPATPSDIVEYARRLEQHTDGEVRAIAFNLGTQPFMLDLDGLERALAHPPQPA